LGAVPLLYIYSIKVRIRLLLQAEDESSLFNYTNKCAIIKETFPQVGEDSNAAGICPSGEMQHDRGPLTSEAKLQVAGVFKGNHPRIMIK
jgi:hypothetical protein